MPPLEIVPPGISSQDRMPPRAFYLSKIRCPLQDKMPPLLKYVKTHGTTDKMGWFTILRDQNVIIAYYHCIILYFVQVLLLQF